MLIGALNIAVVPFALAQEDTAAEPVATAVEEPESTDPCAGYHPLWQRSCRLNLLDKRIDTDATGLCDPYGLDPDRRKCLSRQRNSRFMFMKARHPNYARYTFRRRARNMGDDVKDRCNELRGRRERWVCIRSFLHEYRQNDPRALPYVWQ